MMIFVAKIKIVDGVKYLPKKSFPQGCVCSHCGDKLNGNLIYVNSSLDKDFFCVSCIRNMTKQYKQDRISKAVLFPQEYILYVGTMNHKCGHGSDFFRKELFYFGDASNKKIIEINFCPKCCSYIMRYNDYEKNMKYLKKYIIINSKTGRPLPPTPTADGSIFVFRDNIPKPAEVPSFIQKGAKRPFQGGRFGSK